MTQYELHWLAGLLEGEGCFLMPPPSNPATPRLTLEMTDQDVVHKAAELLGARTVHRRVRGKNKPTYSFCLHGKKALMVMMLLQPHLGERRAAKIQRIVDYCLARARMLHEEDKS